MGGGYYSDALRADLASRPMILGATKVLGCDVETLAQYDVLVLYGNMGCFDDSTLAAYTDAGRGLVATPWIHQNKGKLTALPVEPLSGEPAFDTPLDVNVIDATDALLDGVTFTAGDPVGHEDWTFSLKQGASASVVWSGAADKYAVAKWQYGSGRAVYLNFQYVTSDCALATSYAWGRQLAYNAVLWAGRLK
jgi:hypothetical protein